MKTKIEIEHELRKARDGAYFGEDDSWNEGYQIALESVLGLDIQHYVGEFSEIRNSKLKKLGAVKRIRKH